MLLVNRKATLRKTDATELRVASSLFERDTYAFYAVQRTWRMSIILHRASIKPPAGSIPALHPQTPPSSTSRNILNHPHILFVFVTACIVTFTYLYLRLFFPAHILTYLFRATSRSSCRSKTHLMGEMSVKHVIPQVSSIIFSVLLCFANHQLY
jgi:hypothetical protein